MRTGNNREKNDRDDRAGLLEGIAAESGCMYLSDLRGFIYRERFRIAVTQIPASDYPVEEWQDAAYYMVGSEEKFKTAEEAKQRILGSL